MRPQDITKKLNSVQMVKCEVTGKYFPIDQCEVVTINIIKSKDADINQLNFGKLPEVTFTNTPLVARGAPGSTGSPDLPVNGDIVVPPVKQRTIIPPGIRSLMTPPGMPGESVETRVV